MRLNHGSFLSCLDIAEVRAVGGLLRGKLAVVVLPVLLEGLVGPGVGFLVLRLHRFRPWTSEQQQYGCIAVA